MDKYFSLDSDKEEQLKATSYDLVSYLKKQKVHVYHKQKLTETEKRKYENAPVLDVAQKIVYYSRTNEAGNIFERWAEISSKEEIGFEAENYPRLVSFSKQVHTEMNLKICNCEFIERSIFKWLVNIKLKEKAEKDLIVHLEDVLVQSIKEQKFYFQLENLYLDEEITIGNVCFSLFDKDKYYEFKESCLNTGMEESKFMKFFGNKLYYDVFASVTVFGEKDFSKLKAKEETEMALNFLKLFEETVFNPSIKSSVRMSFNSGYPIATDYFVDDGDGLIFNRENNNSRFLTIDKRKKQELKRHFEFISNFILNHDDNELNSKILKSVKLFGEAISTENLHWRAVLLCQVSDSLFLKKEFEKGMENKVKARLSKFLFEEADKKEKLKADLKHIYSVRHQKIHKNIEIDINEAVYSRTQRMIAVSLFKLMELDGQFANKNELIDYLNSIKS